MDEDAKSLSRSERGPGRNFDYYEVPNSTQAFVDGVNSFSLGAVVTRVDFFQVRKIEDGEGIDGQPLEVREQCLTLVMPTSAFVEFLGNTFKGLKDNRGTLAQAVSDQAEAFSRFLKNLDGADGERP